jgi:hypothetical protein
LNRVPYFSLSCSRAYSTACVRFYDARIGGLISIDLGQPFYNLTFTKNGVHESGYYYGFMSSSISWIKANTPSSAAFMNWWDYGKGIVGCTGRSSVISNPSARFIALGFSANQTERDSEQALTDVGNALFTTNATLTHSIAGKYGAGYLLITVEDGGAKAPACRLLAEVPARMGSRELETRPPMGSVGTFRRLANQGSQMRALSRTPLPLEASLWYRS